MNNMQPLALRMPAVFDRQGFSQEEIQTRTRNLSPPIRDEAHNSPGSFYTPPANQTDPQSPPDLPIMNPLHEPDYFNHSSPGTSETYITATPQGSLTENTTWHMTPIPFELDLDIYMRNKLDLRGTNECLEKAQSKFLKRSPSSNPNKPSTLTEEYRSKTFKRVAITIVPNPSKSTDPNPVSLSLAHLTEILGDEGLLGFFKRTNKYFETHFRVRDVSDAGRGRYVAFGKVKRGTFRGSGSGYVGSPGAADAYDGATLDGEHGTNAEFEAVKNRLEGMRFR